MKKTSVLTKSPDIGEEDKLLEAIRRLTEVTKDLRDLVAQLKYALEATTAKLEREDW